MSTSLGILMTHQYGPQGGNPAICIGLDGRTTDCTWRARRGADGYRIQHLRHLADLIDTAYETDLILQAQLQSIRDHVTSELQLLDALPTDGNEFMRGRRHELAYVAQILNIEGVRL